MTERCTRTGERIIGEFAKNSREVVRVVVGEFKGHQLCHVRIWATAPDGALIPTRAGVAIRLELVPELVEMLHQANKGGAP